MTWLRMCMISLMAVWCRGVDNLVIIDDSIVRGTTLKQSIIGILDRLSPKKIVIVSSSPAGTLSRLLRYRHGKDE